MSQSTQKPLTTDEIETLLRAAREADDSTEEQALTRVADHLAASLRTLSVGLDLDMLRGVEGDAAKKYFSAINHVLKPQIRSAFTFTGRTRRPPLDPINALPPRAKPRRRSGAIFEVRGAGG